MIERSIRRPPVGRFGAIHYGLLRHLLAQVTPDPNRPLTGKRIRNDSLSNMFFGFSPSLQSSLRTWSNLLANRSQGNVNGIPHLPPQPGNYVDKCLWKFRHNMSGNIFLAGPSYTKTYSFPSAAAMDLYGCGCKG